MLSATEDDERPVATNPVTGEIVVRFGQLEPVEIPPDIAIKFALLLLKEAGVVLKDTQRGFVALYNQGKSHRGH